MTLTFDLVDPNTTLVFEVTIPKGTHKKGAKFDLNPTQTHWTRFSGEFLSAQAISMSEDPFGIDGMQAVSIVSGFSTVVDNQDSETPFQTIPRAPERARLVEFVVSSEDFFLTLRLDTDIEVSTPVRLRCFFQGRTCMYTPKKAGLKT